MDNEKLNNLVNDPNVQFFLHATPVLKNLILKNHHPYIKKLKAEVKAALLEDKVLIINKEDVLKFLENKLEAHQMFLLQNGDVRVVGSPAIKLK